MLRSLIFAPVAFLLTFSAGAAETLNFDCKITDRKRGGGWIPSVAVVRVNTTTEEITLLKPTPKQMNGYVDSTELVRDNADKIMVRWIVKGTRSASNQTTPAFKFRASIEKKTGKVKVVATPMGYRNSFHGKGTCVIK